MGYGKTQLIQTSSDKLLPPTIIIFGKYGCRISTSKIMEMEEVGKVVVIVTFDNSQFKGQENLKLDFTLVNSMENLTVTVDYLKLK